MSLDEGRPWTVAVMGVSGSGKTSVAVPVADELQADFLEADAFHPPANVAKMASGTPLTDEDRAPWLDILVEEIREAHDRGRPVVLTCSALKRIYRDHLRQADDQMIFIHLTGDPELIMERMRERQHFMPPALLESQVATLEELDDDERHAEVDVVASLPEVIRRVLRTVRTFLPDA
ncbi:gluconokinase [Propionibacteriaceae bacterium Y2011]|uniref:gluconokinase n=1 Tax=Microlunatus sp. Y2014 TaxID=3418488 RepID=UPI003B45C5DA